MSDTSTHGPVTVALVGCGHRTVGYARHALESPGRMKVVAVAEPDERRRNRTAETFGVPAKQRFDSYQSLAAAGRIADAVINGTMDKMHHASAMPLLKLGYHMLLEKPIARTEAEVIELIDAARAAGSTVMICHVLRYAPFYATLGRLIDEGRIGRVLSMRTLEAVSYDHMATGFVRGRWRHNETNPMLLAKCCHDMDIVAWLNSGKAVARVSSVGARTFFREENAPPGSGTRCLADCEIERECRYSAKRLHVDQGLWKFYAWESIEHLGGADASEADKLESLRTDNPMGHCVWRCDNDVVDHQSVLVQFADGTTATHDMFTNTMRATRQIHVVGTDGEIEGDMESGLMTVRQERFDPGRACDEDVIDVNQEGGGGGGHGGGDGRLVADFVATLLGETASHAVTRIEDSLTGHQIAFAADTAMREGRVVELT